MAIRLADTTKPMGDFPVAEGVDIDVLIDGTPKRLQSAIEDGDIGGGGSSAWIGTKAEFEALDKSILKDGQEVKITDDYADKSIIDDSAISGMTTWSSSQINVNLTELNDSLVDFIKKGMVHIATKDFSNGMDLTNMVVIPDGYKFLCWYNTTSDGFVMDKPIYIANPAMVRGYPFTDENTIPRLDNTFISCYYLLIRA